MFGARTAAIEIDVPTPVTLEHVGLLAVFAYELETRGENFIEFAKEIRENLMLLDSIRAHQQRSRQDNR